MIHASSPSFALVQVYVFPDIDVELSCLPSLSRTVAYGMVYVTNFKVGCTDRTALDVYTLEEVLFRAIKSMYHSSVTIFTTPSWFDALNSKVGISSLAAFAGRFELNLDTVVGTMIRKGDW